MVDPPSGGERRGVELKKSTGQDQPKTDVLETEGLACPSDWSSPAQGGGIRHQSVTVGNNINDKLHIHAGMAPACKAPYLQPYRSSHTDGHYCTHGMHIGINLHERCMSIILNK